MVSKYLPKINLPTKINILCKKKISALRKRRFFVSTNTKLSRCSQQKFPLMWKTGLSCRLTEYIAECMDVCSNNTAKKLNHQNSRIAFAWVRILVLVECLRICVWIGVIVCVCVCLITNDSVHFRMHTYQLFYLKCEYACMCIKYVGADEASILFLWKIVTPRRTSGRLSNSCLRICNIHTFTHPQMYLYAAAFVWVFGRHHSSSLSKIEILKIGRNFHRKFFALCH